MAISPRFPDAGNFMANSQPWHARIEPEIFWVKYQPFLFSRGYELRPRYQPKWAPRPGSLGRGEDSLGLMNANLLDAVKIGDKTKVVLKKVRTWSEEISISLYLSSDELLLDPRNRSVRILEVLPLPDDDSFAILVMPMLMEFSLLPFRRVGEFAEAVHQFIKGLEFMHEHKIAHRDSCLYNLMMDVSKTIPKGYHFLDWRTHDGVNLKLDWRDRWSVRPIEYFFIDFGVSYQYPPGLTGILDTGRYGQDRSVPELSDTVLYDPFKLDIYQLGNVIINVANEYEGLEAFLEIGQMMTRASPEERPNASEAVKRIECFLATLTKSDLKRRVWPRKYCSSWDRFRIKYCGANPL